LTRRRAALLLFVFSLCVQSFAGPSQVVRARRGMVVSQSLLASEAGAQVLHDGGDAVDAAVATAFALAVTHPIAGNIGGGGFLLLRTARGEAHAYDFREKAPAAATPTMFLDDDGDYDADRHHNSHLSVGVPGTVAGLHLAWKEHGKLPWRRLVEPAIALARDGFPMSFGLARSLKEYLPQFRKYPASFAQFSKGGAPYAVGDLFKQPDLARTLERIALLGPAGFYEGETAALLEKEMKAGGGLLTAADLRAYEPRSRVALQGTYRGYEVIGVPPVSSGGITLLLMLNVLEGYELRSKGALSAASIHLTVEAMRRAYADRARYLGDPDFNPEMPVDRLVSKGYAAELRKTIREDRASTSAPTSFEWPAESGETTHLSVVDDARNAVSLTYTLEDNYGAKIVVPGAGFLLNNEMGDFNAGPGLTNADGLLGTAPNLAAPGKRMLSSMTPTILARDGKLFMVIGSPGGRTIINTVLQVVINIIDYDMNLQQAVDAPRFHHQWMPNELAHGYLRDGKDWGTMRDKPWDSDGPYWHLRANGGILSTAGDMYRWHLALLGETVLPKSAKDKYFKPHIPERPVGVSHYGYGWVIDQTPRGTTVITHNGSNGIFATINVVTIPPEEFQGTLARVETGSFGEKKVQAAMSVALGHGAKLLLSGSVLNNAGEHSLYFPQADSPATNYGRAIDMNSEKGYHLFGDFTWHNWRVTALFGGSQRVQPISWGPTIFNDRGTRITDLRNFVEATYTHTFDTARVLEWRTSYDSYRGPGIFHYPLANGVEDNRNFFCGDWISTQVSYRTPVPHFGSLTIGVDTQFDLRALQRVIDVAHGAYDRREV
jgi:gamma-glutamyltranspeptidase/glutathione hydrolase